LLSFALALPLCPGALAGAYTVEDLGLAAQRGLSGDALELIVADVGPLDATGVVTLLRYGVHPDWIGAHTGGAHPTPDEVAAAALAGPLTPPPREFSGLSDSAWLGLVGADIVLRLSSSTVEGRLQGVATGVLSLATAEGARDISLVDVSTVRRADGGYIVVRPGWSPPPPSDQDATVNSPTRVGRSLLWVGIGALVLGTSAAVVGSAEGGIEGGALFLVGGLGITSGVPLTVGGVITLAVGSHRDRHAGDRAAVEPAADDAPAGQASP